MSRQGLLSLPRCHLLEWWFLNTFPGASISLPLQSAHCVQFIFQLGSGCAIFPFVNSRCYLSKHLLPFWTVVAISNNSHCHSLQSMPHMRELCSRWQFCIGVKAPVLLPGPMHPFPSISCHFQPRWWMSTEISIRAIFTTICPQRIQLKQLSRKFEISCY